MRLKVCADCGLLFEVKKPRDRRCAQCSRPDPRWSREYRRAKEARIRFVEIDRGRVECEGCGVWPAPLQAHHVDGDRAHHAVDNLRMLCTDCHQAATDQLAGRPTFASPSVRGSSALDSEQGATPRSKPRASTSHPAASRCICGRKQTYCREGGALPGEPACVQPAAGRLPPSVRRAAIEKARTRLA